MCGEQVLSDWGMAGSTSKGPVVEKYSEASELQGQSGGTSTERLSCEVDNGSPSTSPSFWGSDDDDDGEKPSNLYNRHTWKVEKFSETSKRELKSDVFVTGTHNWHILIYPRGCDVCNHLSLFLCVSDYERLDPGWSHFAQFTIVVVNKDSKKTKYSDTLHRFWRKEHDWGWKKFMELPKLDDGFLVDDTLEIRAQVQVIRERSDRPFRCLARLYRRELARVYITTIEQIHQKFVEEQGEKLRTLIENKARWSSLRLFWKGINKSERELLSMEKADMILRVVVEKLFVKKEVTSTVVMDSLYSGLKFLECQSKSIHVQSDVIVLAEDAFLLVEKAVESLPPKDEKSSPKKDGSSGDGLIKDSNNRDDRLLTQLGHITLEIFIVAHIFSNKIELAYEEAVAWQRQAELIREEEAEWEAKNKQKEKRRVVDKDKEKRSKKKQNKKKNKGKVKGKAEKYDVAVLPKNQLDTTLVDRTEEDSIATLVDSLPRKCDSPVDESDLFDLGDDDISEILHDIYSELEDRDVSPIKSFSSRMGDLPGQAQTNVPLTYDSSSTCSTDSVPSVVVNGPYKSNCLSNNNNQTSSSRGKNQRSKDASRLLEADNASTVHQNIAEKLHELVEPETKKSVISSRNKIRKSEQLLVDKEEKFPSKKIEKHVDINRPQQAPAANASGSVLVRITSLSSTVSKTKAAQNQRINGSKPAAQNQKINDSKPTSCEVENLGTRQATTSTSTSYQKKALASQIVPSPKLTSNPSSLPHPSSPLGLSGPGPSPKTYCNTGLTYRDAITGSTPSSSPPPKPQSPSTLSLTFGSFTPEVLHTESHPIEPSLVNAGSEVAVRNFSVSEISESCQTERSMMDEFPLMHMIDQLLDDENETDHATNGNITFKGAHNITVPIEMAYGNGTFEGAHQNPWHTSGSVVMTMGSHRNMGQTSCAMDMMAYGNGPGEGAQQNGSHIMWPMVQWNQRQLHGPMEVAAKESWHIAFGPNVSLGIQDRCLYPMYHPEERP